MRNITLEKDIRKKCKEIIEHPTKAGYVTAKQLARELDDDVTPRQVGGVLTDADYAEKWSDVNYRIAEDKL